jgi:hypothetical protein
LHHGGLQRRHVGQAEKGARLLGGAVDIESIFTPLPPASRSAPMPPPFAMSPARDKLSVGGRLRNGTALFNMRLVDH